MSENEVKDRSPSRAKREKRAPRPAQPADASTVNVNANTVAAATVTAPSSEVIPARTAAPAPRGTRARATSRPPAPAPSEREAVLQANAMFYRAFELRDIEGMAEVWAREPYVRCIHPGWEPLCGWDEIVGSWGQIFRGIDLLRFELSDLTVRVGGHLAWIELCEKLEATHGGKPARSTVLATNIFERQPDGRWQMIHHHASPVLNRQPNQPRKEPLH